MSSVNVAYTGLRRFDVERGSALSAVSVASSNLDEISPSVSYLEAAQDIAITSCLIESVDLGVFCNMAKLQLLNFYGNRIRYVKNSANSNCSLYDSLTTLTLSQNYLQSLNMGLLSPFRSLALLNVNENRVEAVFGSYETDANLTMFLQKNKIKSFDVCTWYVPRMHSLDLQHNQLSTVPNCLEKLNGVSQLILAFNQLSNVSIESFAKMESLVYLNLCCNSMTSISFNTTRYPISLRTVLLAENNLTALDLSLVAVPSNIAHISPSISNLKASRNIAVTNCWLESLDLGAFCDMPKLNMLNFCENRIRYIQNSANSNCSLYNSLETLTLSRNFLRSLNMELFNPFRSLMYLTLKENRIEAVFGQFETDTDFNLFLTNNNIKVFDVCEWNVPRMLWLELQHNNLSTVPNCLEHLKSVQSIALSYNQLANVSIESFAKMESLSKLILSSNSMTLISFNTDQYPANLRTVWITNNNLTELDLSLVAVSSLEVNAQDNYIEVFD
uniref:Uncharacterized protein n=1 Tax=Anopheles stephensi TaxID=30069 RepID=A0A182XWN4_ANOST